MSPGYDPDPFVVDPFDAPEAERVEKSVSALALLVADVRAGLLSEDAFFARRSSGLSDLSPQTGRHWLWRVHHRHNEVWKCLGRPNWSVAAYAAWRDQFYNTPAARRLDRHGHPRKETFPKLDAGLTGLRHEHVVPMGLMLRALLDAQVTPAQAIDLNVDAIITIGEDRLLDKSGHPDLRDPWLRYASTGIKFLPNINWSPAHAEAMARHGLVAQMDEMKAAFRSEHRGKLPSLTRAPSGASHQTRPPLGVRAIAKERKVQREQDTNQAALAGQLRKCGAVSETFIALDRALDQSRVSLDKQALTKGSEWFARSYKLDGRTIVELHPKNGWLKVKLGAEYAAMAPKPLLPVGEIRDSWINIEPRDQALGIQFVVDVVKRKAGR
ncbi:MAG: hypothetical protein JWP23_3167 [Phenylobacterium sp.]|nr:hypothetical protein [Phenylobacterium sp.]